MIDRVGHAVGESWRNFAKMFMGSLKDSKFYQEGVLTPEEFVAAGDFLTEKCPTWKWCSSKKELRDNSLPEHMQYLITTVPCPKRAIDYEKQNNTTETVVDDDWVEANVTFYKRNKEEKVIDFDQSMENKQIIVENSSKPMDLDLEIDVVPQENAVEAEEDFIVIEENHDNVIKTRTYDVSVTYDKYYRVPRMWLIGYSEEGIPLTEEEMKQDIMMEYIDRTVTIEKHPCTGIKSISIHPCKHSLLLKKMIDNYERAGKTLEVYMSILIFLKFLHSVVPTIQYDFTMDINF